MPKKNQTPYINVYEMLYGVAYLGSTGKWHLALNCESGRWTSFNRKKAINFKDELAAHLKCKCKVVKLRVRYETEMV